MVMKKHNKAEFVGYLEGMVDIISGMHRKKPLSYCCMEDFVLKNGQFYADKVPSEDVPRGELKQCFANSQKLAEKQGLRYVEGYASGILPVIHAWVISEDGKVIDPTWEFGEFYFGVVFPIWYLRKVNLLRGSYGVLDAWDIGWPLLTGEHKYPISEQFEETEE